MPSPDGARARACALRSTMRACCASRGGACKDEHMPTMPCVGTSVLVSNAAQACVCDNHRAAPERRVHELAIRACLFSQRTVWLCGACGSNGLHDALVRCPTSRFGSVRATALSSKPAPAASRQGKRPRAERRGARYAVARLRLLLRDLNPTLIYSPSRSATLRQSQGG